MSPDSSAKNEALLLVHLSDFEIYVWECGTDAGAALGMALQKAIEAYPGPVVLTGQEKPVSHLECAQLLVSLQKHALVIWFHHDGEQWDEPMQRLGRVLHGLGVTSLRIGGIWATENGVHGCVNVTMRYLALQGFTCTLDEQLCGFERTD